MTECPKCHTIDYNEKIVEVIDGIPILLHRCSNPNCPHIYFKKELLKYIGDGYKRAMQPCEIILYYYT
jgi:hypothetical protein